MKPICVALILLLSIWTVPGLAQRAFPDLKGPYLGQKPPGKKPEVFAPGIVSTKDWEIEGVFAPGMNAFYFARYRGSYSDAKTYVIKLENGVWRESIVEPRRGEVFISLDGNTMYLGNSYRERTPSGWSEKKSIGAMFDPYRIMRLTESARGTYVFDHREKVGAIRYSRIVDGKRQEPKAFGADINTGTYIAHPFIAPDESYLIWDAQREGGYGDSDLYISYRQEDGSWSRAINMGSEINTGKEEAFGSVTPDGQFFFFHRFLGEGKANIYWMDAQIIEALRPK